MRRWIVVLLGLAALGVLFAVLRPRPEPGPTASPSPTTTATPTTSATPEGPTRIQISVKGGEVTGPGRVIKVDLDKRVLLVVRSDVNDEVHIHGYDLTAEVGPGHPAQIRFRADVPGFFEVELEASGLFLLRLEVSP